MKNTTGLPRFEIYEGEKNTIFEETDTDLWKWANYFLIFLVVLSIFIAYISTIWEIHTTYFIELFIVDFFISSIFAIEYFYRWSNSRNKNKFPFLFLNILDLISFLPFFLLLLFIWPGIYSLLAIFRLFRILRIIELFERTPITKMFIRWLNKHKLEIVVWLFIIMLILIIFSSLLYIVEHTWWNKVDFNSLPSATRWGIYALTTSWDSWIQPITLVWKILAWVLMSIWPMFISIISSVLIVIFLDSTNILTLKKSLVPCWKCSESNDSRNKYCTNCWHKL